MNARIACLLEADALEDGRGRRARCVRRGGAAEQSRDQRDAYAGSPVAVTASAGESDGHARWCSSGRRDQRTNTAPCGIAIPVTPFGKLAR
jgi:hypothetical protein